MSLSALTSASCEAGAPSAPWQGYAVAVVQTNSNLPDSDGYTLGLDATHRATVTDNDSVVFALSAPGEHNLQIAGLADYCASRDRDGIIRVAPSDHDTARVVFDVDCYDPTVRGVLDIRVVGGPAARRPKHFVYVDGLRETPSPLSTPITLLVTVSGGWHNVELSPGNSTAMDCIVEGDFEQTIEVTTTDTLGVGFAIDFCN